MGLIEGLSMGTVATIIYSLGLPGAVLILWYVDNRRYDRQEKKRDRELTSIIDALKTETSRVLRENKDDMNRVLEAYKDDLRAVTRFYEDNVLLVKNYQKLADDLAGIITLNTQVQTKLVEKIDHNMYCPVVRGKGPQ